jgi:uncharacterized protein (DUF983 family)
MPVEVTTLPRAERSLWTAVGRGVMCRCPNCGKGKLFRSYLKIADTCSECGEELKWHRADDFPPYIAIFIVGHLLVGYLLHQEMTQPLEPIVYMATLLPLALILPLVILPSVKGAVVGMQWAIKMGEFDPARRRASA